MFMYMYICICICRRQLPCFDVGGKYTAWATFAAEVDNNDDSSSNDDSKIVRILTLSDNSKIVLIPAIKNNSKNSNN